MRNFTHQAIQNQLALPVLTLLDKHKPANIVRLHGLWIDAPDTYVRLIMDPCSRGSLRNMLKGKPTVMAG